MNDTYFFGKRMSFNEGGRARFNVGGTGNQDAEAQGLDYISNNQYLQDDFTGSTPLDFSNVSSSGIMSQAPVPAPLKYMPEGGGGDDDGGPKDYGYTGPGSTGSAKGFDIEDIGEGTIDDEDDDTTGMGKLGAAKSLGTFSFMGPLAGIFSAYRNNKKAKQEEIDKINAKINSQYGLGGVLNDPNTVGGSSVDTETGGSFGRSANEATGAHGPGTGFSDYS